MRRILVLVSLGVVGAALALAGLATARMSPELGGGHPGPAGPGAHAEGWGGSSAGGGGDSGAGSSDAAPASSTDSSATGDATGTGDGSGGPAGDG